MCSVLNFYNLITNNWKKHRKDVTRNKPVKTSFRFALLLHICHKRSAVMFKGHFISTLTWNLSWWYWTRTIFYSSIDYDKISGLSRLICTCVHQLYAIPIKICDIGSLYSQWILILCVFFLIKKPKISIEMFIFKLKKLALTLY